MHINVKILLIVNHLIFKPCIPKTPSTPLMFSLHAVRAQPCFNAANLFLLVLFYYIVSVCFLIILLANMNVYCILMSVT